VQPNLIIELQLAVDGFMQPASTHPENRYQSLFNGVEPGRRDGRAPDDPRQSLDLFYALRDAKCA
jgi:hypothetical protein